MLSKPSGKKPSELAYARIVLNDCFVLKGTKVINGKFGLFIAGPRDSENGNTYFAITKEFHDKISDAVLDAYKNWSEK